MRVALVSDTHGVWDPALAGHFAGADTVLHAGDVGSHGGHAAVLDRLRQVCPQVHAVRGNVDDDAAARQHLPDSLLLTLAGWSVLLIHILADAAAAIQRHQLDIVVSGHSHSFAVQEVAGPQGALQLRVNPGSAGPARFRLGRTAALLTLPPKGSGARPSVQRIELAGKAPPRLPEAGKAQQSRKQSRKQPPQQPTCASKRSRRPASASGSQAKRAKV